jgi:hypothetical protein
MWKYGETIIRVGRGWTDDNGTQHPRQWNRWTADEKAAHGLVWEDDAPTFDSRFYWSHDVPKRLDDVNEVDENGDPLLDEDGNQVVTKGLKTVAIETVKAQAGSLLSATDWYVVRKAETSVDIPDSVMYYRAAVRNASGAIENAINDATTFDAFKALYDAPVDADGNPTGNAPINDFPETI